MVARPPVPDTTARTVSQEIHEFPALGPTVTRTPAVPAGFRVGGTTAGIKASGRPDLMLITATNGPVAAAAVFTSNAFAAAPVTLSQQHLAATEPAGDGRYGWADAVIATSGCANAATGTAGLADQRAIARAVAAAVGT